GGPEDDRDQCRDDGADRDDPRPLALLQWLELLARGLVLLLVAGGHLLAPLDSPGLALLARGPLSLAVGHQTGAAWGSAARRARAAASGSSASRIARTTTTRSAPASATCATLAVSFPPIATRGFAGWRAA